MNEKQTTRLNRYLAQCGQGSRRAAEALIAAGKVSLNGKVVTDLATQVDPAKDKVRVEGRPVVPAHTMVYLMLHKPRGYEVTRVAGNHRRVYDLLPDWIHASVKSVGRLDRESTGLLLFTNDGQLAHRLTHPSFGCTKTYEVEVEGMIAAGALIQMREGLRLEDGPAKPVAVDRIAGAPRGCDWLRIVMQEGRKRIVRRMCEEIGHPVVLLHRCELGGLKLGDLPKGESRKLTPAEVDKLRKRVGLAEEKPASTKPAPRRPAPPRRRPK